jgi:hypothetical protein
MTIDDQPGFDLRLAWASEGGALLARVCPVSISSTPPPDLPTGLATCASGLELAARGLAAGLRLAAEHDVSRAVPRLSGDAFAQLS